MKIYLASPLFTACEKSAVHAMASANRFICMIMRTMKFH